VGECYQRGVDQRDYNQDADRGVQYIEGHQHDTTRFRGLPPRR
jgi:hypothetical protein